MIVINDIEQASEAWFELKAGVISASRAAEFSAESKLAPLPDDFTHTKEGKVNVASWGDQYLTGTSKADLVKLCRESLPPVYGDMRQSYMAELVGQIVTGLLPNEMSFKQCEWGNEHEDSARALFELELGLDVEVPAFIYKDKNKRCGISPDGLIVGKKIGLELKCPFTTKVFVEFATCDKIKKEYIEQCQYSMWVTGYDSWYFANYDPRIKTKNLHWVLIERDQSYMNKYDEAFKSFTKDMDSMLNKLGMEFGQQWQ